MAVYVNNKALLLGLLGVAGIVAIYLYYPSKESDNKAALSAIEVKDTSKDSLLKKLTDHKLPIRDGNILTSWEDQKLSAVANKGIHLDEAYIDVSGTQLFTRTAVDSNKPPAGVFLFLHGQKFSSKTWLDLGTLNVTANNAYKVIAVDLPGYGKSKKYDVKDTTQFMLDLMKVLQFDNANKPILVSPSMSGRFSVPLYMKHPEVFQGYIPVAPVSVSEYKPDQYKSSKVPTCSIVGDKDTSLGKTAHDMFTLVPSSETHTLKDAGHACYMDQPQQFHQIMFAFAKTVFGA